MVLKILKKLSGISKNLLKPVEFRMVKIILLINFFCSSVIFAQDVSEEYCLDETIYFEAIHNFLTETFGVDKEDIDCIFRIKDGKPFVDIEVQGIDFRDTGDDSDTDPAPEDPTHIRPEVQKLKDELEQLKKDYHFSIRNKHMEYEMLRKDFSKLVTAMNNFLQENPDDEYIKATLQDVGILPE